MELESDSVTVGSIAMGNIAAHLSRTKRADGTSASAETTKKNAPQRKVGLTAHVRGANAGERRDDSSRDAPTDARETRRRYSADEVSRCGRWMQRAGGVALFPEGRDEHVRR